MSDLNPLCLKGKKRELKDFNDWGGYMGAKIRKLDEQFDVMENGNEQSNVLNDLFKNIVIFVNGYTVPSSDELKRLMKKHGGGFQHYYSRSKCTHIIATNLPDSKIKELKAEKVVHPDWILDSIKSGAILPYRQYLLYGPGKNEVGSLKNVFKFPNVIADANCMKSGSSSNDVHGKREMGKGPDLERNVISESVTHSCIARPGERQSDASACETILLENHENSADLLKDDIFGSSELFRSEKYLTGGSLELCQETEVIDHREIVDNEMELTESDLSGVSPTLATETIEGENENCLDESPTKYENESKAMFTKPKNRPGLGSDIISLSGGRNLPQHSLTKKAKSVPKAGDANFVNDYYSHSRLHYLSTWGAEFRDFINNLIQTTEIKTGKRLPIKGSSKRRVIMHIDMDSFFVSVALRSRSELRGKPVAVCHAGRGSNTLATTDSSNSSSSFGSTSEIASCSYEARSFGVKNGMWLGQARQLCPDLVCVPYQFAEYRQVSQQLYEILASYTHEIQAVSCDEAFVDLTNYIEAECLTSLEVAQKIRDEIKKKTNCPASAGISSNILLARMCTKVAKPNGQFHLQYDDTAEFIGKQNVADLPGVGYALNEKLKSLNVITCSDLQRISISILRREFGQKTGEMLFNFSRGKDERQLKIERERKSVSAEINYAMRFVQESEPEKFIYDLSNEVHKRLKSVGVKGKQVTFKSSYKSLKSDNSFYFDYIKNPKLRVRQKDAPINPTKFMGCGRCDNISRSTNMSSSTDNSSVIAKECISMLKHLAVPVSDIRGMGIQMSKLSDDSKKASSTSKTLDNFLKPIKASSNTSTKKSGEIGDASTNAEGANTDNCNKMLDCGSLKVSSFGTSDHLGANLDDFKLVLSDDEDQPTFDLLEKGKTDYVSTVSNGQRDEGRNSVCPVKEGLGTGKHMPPLPVFPIFSPKSSSNSNKISSPTSKTSSRSKSPARRNKKTPNKSPRKSPNKSPGKLNFQRSLYQSFQSSKGSDASNTLALPSPSQIDPVVFAALPEEIKNDIKITYRQRNQKFGTQDHVSKLFPPSECHPEAVRFPPPGLTKNSKQDNERNARNAKKAKINHKSIKSFASKQPNKDDKISQVDASVLDVLPEYLRHEVQYAYEQQKRYDEKEKKKNDLVNVDKNMCLSGPTELIQGYETDIPPVSYFTPPKVCLAGVESLPEVREMLKLWTNDTQVPLDEDVRLLVEYLSSLIFHKDLEKMGLVLKFYRRLVLSKQTWQPLFNTVLDSVQDILKQNYGGELPIKHFVIA